MEALHSENILGPLSELGIELQYDDGRGAPGIATQICESILEISLDAPLNSLEHVLFFEKCTSG